MPKVPTYSQGQITQRPLPGIRLNPSATSESFGSGQARDVARLGQAFGVASDTSLAIIKASQIRRDKALVRDSLNAVKSDLRTFMGDIYQRQGKDAIDSYAEVEKKMLDIRRAAGSEFKNSQQRALFEASFSDLMNGHLDRAIVFQEKARRDFEIETLDAENQSFIDDAVAARTDIKEVAKAEQGIVANTRFKNRGKGAAITKESVKQAVHHLHSEVLSAVSQDSPEAALAYLTDNFDKFDPSVREEVKTQLEIAVKDAKIRNMAIAISGSGLALEEQLAEIDSIADNEIADAVRKRVIDRDSVKNSAVQAQRKAVYEQEWQAMFKNPFTYQIPNTNALSPSQKQNLYDTQQSLIKDNLATQGVGSKTQTNWGVYYDWVSRSKEDIAQADLTEVFPQLADTQKNALIKMQQDARKQGDDFVKTQSIESYINQFVKSTGLELDNEKDFEKASVIRELFETQLNSKPADQRDSIETWNNIRDELTLEYNRSFKLFGPGFRVLGLGSRNAIDARMEGDVIDTEPVEKPKGVPRKAKWIDENEDGVRVRGWLLPDPETGVHFLYGTDGGTYTYQRKPSIRAR